MRPVRASRRVPAIASTTMTWRAAMPLRASELAWNCASVGLSCWTRAMIGHSPNPGTATCPVRNALMSGHVHSVRCRCISSRVRPDTADPLAHLLVEDRGTESALRQGTLSSRRQMRFGPGTRRRPRGLAGVPCRCASPADRTGQSLEFDLPARAQILKPPADLVICPSQALIALQRPGLAFSRSPSRNASRCTL